SQCQATHTNPALFQSVPVGSPALDVGRLPPDVVNRPPTPDTSPEVRVTAPVRVFHEETPLPPPPLPGPYHSPHTRAPACGASPKVTLEAATLKSVPGCCTTPSTEMNSSTAEAGDIAAPLDATLSG